MRKPEDLTKVSISYRSPNGTVVSRFYSDIDQQLVQDAQVILDKQNTMFSVMHQDESGASYTVASFDTIAQARDYQRANPNKLGGKLVIKNPSNQAEADQVKVGQKALELSLDRIVSPDAGIRTSRIESWVKSEKLKHDSTWAKNWGSYVYSAASFGLYSPEQVVRTMAATDKRDFVASVSSALELAREIYSGDADPYRPIPQSLLMPLTGFDPDSARRAGLKSSADVTGVPFDPSYQIRDLKRFITEDTIRTLETKLKELSKEKQ